MKSTRVEVKNKMDRGDRFLLIDVREPHEYQICSIPSAKLIPLGDLPKRVHELDSAVEIVAHCKSGVRSGKACDFLRQAGFRKVKNMKGGILAWSDKVDPSVPNYRSRSDFCFLRSIRWRVFGPFSHCTVWAGRKRRLV